jgi:hypothetical protein
MRFMGEQMTCIMCGKQEKSDPTVESQWRCIEVDGDGYYACPAHFPPDETGRARQFQKAYSKILARIIRLRRHLE